MVSFDLRHTDGNLICDVLTHCAHLHYSLSAEPGASSSTTCEHAVSYMFLSYTRTQTKQQSV